MKDLSRFSTTYVQQIVSRLKFGIAIPNSAPYCDAKILREVPQLAEKLGYDYFLLPDHFLWSWGNQAWDAFAALAYVTGITTAIRIGTCVTPIPLRSPIQAAKTIATIDVISGGRFILGAGAGWGQREFEVYSSWDSPKIRARKAAEGLRLIINLWTMDIVNFAGDYYAVRKGALEPKPIQKPHPPVWVGTTKNSQVMLRVAAELGAGWIPLTWTHSSQDYAVGKTKIETLARQLGRNVNFTWACLGGLVLQNDTDPRTVNVDSTGFEANIYAKNGGDCARHIELVEEYRKAGCEVYVPVGCYPQNRLTDLMRQFAATVIPSF